MTARRPAILGAPGEAGWLRAAVGPALVAGTVLMLVLSIYPARGLTTPVGWDSTQYVWRTSLVREVGIQGTPDAVPPFVRVKVGRPAYPVLGALVSSLEGVNPFVATVVLPGVLAAAVALAAFALAAFATRAPPASAAVVGLLVGVSPQVVLMLQYAYLENLMVAAVLLAAAVPVLAATSSWRPAGVAVALLGAIALLHASFFAVAVAIVLLAAALLLPGSWRTWRTGGSGPWETPSARLGAIGLGGGALGAAALFGVVGRGPRPQLETHQFEAKLRQDLPRYGYAVTLPLAAGGGWSLPRGDGRRRAYLALLGAWLAVSAGAWVASRVTSLPVPANRFLLFAMPVPILAGHGLVALAAWARSRWGARVARAGLALALAGAAGVGLFLWLRTLPQTDPHKLRDAAWAAQYLDAAGVPDETPVVVIVDTRQAEPQLDVDFMRDHLFAAMPPGRIDDVYTYLGTPEDYLAARPSLLGDGGRYDKTSKRLFSRMRATYDRDPVAVMLTSFNFASFDRWVATHPGAGDEVLSVVRGPAVPGGMSFEDPRTSARPAALGLLSVLTLALLGLAGLGWCLAFLRPWLERPALLALAPAVGIAVLVAAGTVADRLGLRLAVPGAVGTALAAGGAGWLLAHLRSRRAKA